MHPLPRGILFEELLEADADTNQRWTFWGRSLIAGRIYSAKIPKVDFGEPHSEGLKILNKMYLQANQLGYSNEASVWILEWIHWALGGHVSPAIGYQNSLTREKYKFEPKFPQIPEKLSQRWYETFKPKPFLFMPADYLARWLGELGVKGGPGWFATPMGICNLMSSITIGEEIKPWQSLADECAGTGSMLLPGTNKSLNIYAADVSYTMVLALHVNAYFYTPWMIFPFPQTWLNDLKWRTQDAKKKKKKRSKKR
jgi:hypothetical protein